MQGNNRWQSIKVHPWNVEDDCQDLIMLNRVMNTVSLKQGSLEKSQRVPKLPHLSSISSEHQLKHPKTEMGKKLVHRSIQLYAKKRNQSRSRLRDLKANDNVTSRTSRHNKSTLVMKVQAIDFLQQQKCKPVRKRDIYLRIFGKAKKREQIRDLRACRIAR